MSSTKIEIIRGDDHTLSVDFKDQDNVAIDLTWATVHFTVKGVNDVKSDDTDAIIHKEITVHTNAVAWLTDIVLTDEDTTPAGLYYYDLQVVHSDGTKNSIPRGYLEILSDNTKA